MHIPARLLALALLTTTAHASTFQQVVKAVIPASYHPIELGPQRYLLNGGANVLAFDSVTETILMSGNRKSALKSTLEISTRFTSKWCNAPAPALAPFMTTLYERGARRGNVTQAAYVGTCRLEADVTSAELRFRLQSVSGPAVWPPRLQ